MSTGEKSFSTSNTKKTKRNFDPAKAGDYDLKLLKNVEIRVAEPKMYEKGKLKGKMSKPVPRVSTRFEILDTSEEGGRNKLYFHDFTCNMKPNEDGQVLPQGADQLKGFSDGIGVDAEIPCMMYQPKGTSSPEDKVKILDPRALKKWLEEQADSVVRGHLKVQGGTTDYPEPKNKLTEFFDAGSGTVEGDNDGGLSEEGSEDSANSDDEALEDLPDMDADEEKPKKAAAKPVQKGKPVQKRR